MPVHARILVWEYVHEGPDALSWKLVYDDRDHGIAVKVSKSDEAKEKSELPLVGRRLTASLKIWIDSGMGQR
jgi:hypothetical protein